MFCQTKFLFLYLITALWCKMINSSPVGDKEGKKLQQLGDIQNIGSLLFKVNHNLSFFSEFSNVLPLLMTFSILVRGKNDFFVKVAEFHTKNVIFKVEYLTEEQKRARIFNGFVQSDDKRSQKLQHCAYPLISGLKLFKMHHSAVYSTTDKMYLNRSTSALQLINVAVHHQQMKRTSLESQQRCTRDVNVCSAVRCSFALKSMIFKTTFTFSTDKKA